MTVLNKLSKDLNFVAHAEPVFVLNELLCSDQDIQKPFVPIANNCNADDTGAALYEALQSGDIDKLMAYWANEDEFVCIRPGGGDPRVV